MLHRTELSRFHAVNRIVEQNGSVSVNLIGLRNTGISERVFLEIIDQDGCDLVDVLNHCLI
jgi:RecB family exonuclease